MLKLQPFGSTDLLTLLPFLACPIRSRVHQPMQYRGEHRPFHVELELPIRRQLTDHRLAARLVPDPFEHQGSADLPLPDFFETSLPMNPDQHAVAGESSSGRQQRVQLP